MNCSLPSKYYSVRFPSTDCEQHLAQLAHHLNGVVVNSDTVRLAGGFASGLVRRLPLETGCCLRAWDVAFSCPVSFNKCGQPSANKSFTILYVLTPGTCRLQYIGDHEQFTPTQVRSSLMAANDIDLRFALSPNESIQVLEINVTTFWLARRLREAGLPLESLLEKIQGGAKPLVLHQTSSNWVINQVNKLFNLVTNGLSGIEQVRPFTDSLVIDLLQKMVGSEAPQRPGNAALHLRKVMEAEAILQAHLQRTLPNMNDIAQQVSLSESTLKRHFKLIFGKSLYEYYLEKKMNLAKTLLQEQPLTVYEAASRLGYEKVSNFIGIFKKHHGCSPGTIKRKALTNV